MTKANPSTDKRKHLGTLRSLATSFTVESLANGHMLVKPKWRKGYGGLFSRLAMAARMKAALTRSLRDGR